MKRIIIVAILILLFSPAFAEHVNPETAQQVATTFWKQNLKQADDRANLSCTQTFATDFPNLYIFNIEQGWIILSADDCAVPILAYSPEGSFDIDHAPDAVKYWLDGYNDAIDFAISQGGQADEATRAEWRNLKEGKALPRKSNQAMEPLIEARWYQTSPYNLQCPTVISTGAQCYTGCPATAMAEVMKYWEWPAIGKGEFGFGEGDPLFRPTSPVAGHEDQYYARFDSLEYAWNKMTNTYSNASTDEARNAVAWLMYHCSVSCQTSYGAHVSGARFTMRESPNADQRSVEYALKNHFYYDADLHSAFKSDYATDTEWIALMKEELDAEGYAGRHRPILYASTAHAFVMDGYDDNGKFHFDFGWGGAYRGYFTIDNIQPYPGYNFTTGQRCLLGVQPRSEQNTIPAPTGLTAVTDDANRTVTLSWNAAQGVTGYKIYRNGICLGTVDNVSTYTDRPAAFGTNTYHVRGVDDNGAIYDVSFEKSNEVESSITPFDTPVITSVTQNYDGRVQVNWNPLGRAASYHVYREGALVANVETTTFIDNNMPLGSTYYTVKGVDAFGDESPASNRGDITVTNAGPVPQNVCAVSSANGNVISWNEPISDEKQMQYYSEITEDIGEFGWAGFRWGQKFTPSVLEQYPDRVIGKIKLYVIRPERFTLDIFNMDNDGNEMYLVHDIAFETNENEVGSYHEVVLDNPVAFDYDKDLWISFTVNAYSEQGGQVAYINGGNANAGYQNFFNQPGLANWSESNCTWLMSIGLSNGSYTYEVFCNGESLAQNLSETSFTDEDAAEGLNVYKVQTHFLNTQSNFSNIAAIATGQAVLDESLTLGEYDKLQVMPNSTLTVGDNGLLTCHHATSLILEPGAQLIHSNSGVMATMKKSVDGYGNGNGNWCLVSSPTTESLAVSEVKGMVVENVPFDLYRFNQSAEHEWQNYRKHGFGIDEKMGYLYASETNTILEFAGTLVAHAEPTELTFEPLSAFAGWNLVGNPFPCNVYIEQEYYTLNEDGSDLMVAQPAEPIAPCSAVMVKAEMDITNLIFSKAAHQAAPDALDVSVSLNERDHAGILDRAIIGSGSHSGLEKLNLRDDVTRLYFSHDGLDYAVLNEMQQNVTLYFKAAKTGNYTLHLRWNDDKPAYLHDRLTGENRVLNAGMNEYVFEAKPTDYAARFSIVFDDEDANADESFCIYADGKLKVTSDGRKQSVNIVDTCGRMVWCDTFTGDYEKAINLPAGIYVVVLNGKGQKITVM